MEAPDFRALCAGMLHDFDDLVKNSDGVAGLHRNGDIADWNSLTEGQEFMWTEQFARARAALEAVPAIGTPTDDQIMGVWNSDDCEARLTDQEIAENHSMTESECYRRQQIAFARAVLARYATPAPVPSAERPWVSDGWCDNSGLCWCFSLYAFGAYMAGWAYRQPAPNIYDTHFLPHWALPLPEAQP